MLVCLSEGSCKTSRDKEIHDALCLLLKGGCLENKAWILALGSLRGL